MIIFATNFLYFLIYSFLGWSVEVVYCSVPQKKFVNRGFLYSPLCPIYGVGAIVLILILEPLYDYWYLIFLISIVLTSVLEYVTSFALEKIFKMHWWDYSNRKLNIHGRVCARNSVCFGFLALAVIYLIHPLIIEAVDLLTIRALYILTGSFIVFISIDLMVTIFNMIGFSAIIRRYLNLISDKIIDIKEKKEDERYFSKRFKYFKNRFPKMHYKTKQKDINIFEKMQNYFNSKKSEKKD